MSNDLAVATALAMQQAWERTITPALQQAKINGDQWLKEVVATARLAAADGDYTAAFKGYELAAKKLGLLQAEQSLTINCKDLTLLSDDALQARSRLEASLKTIEATVIDPSEAQEAW